VFSFCSVSAADFASYTSMAQTPQSATWVQAKPYLRGQSNGVFTRTSPSQTIKKGPITLT
jgi:hypothetical protein